MKNNIDTYIFAKQFIDKGGALFRSYCGLGRRDPYCNAYVTYVMHHTSNRSLYCDGKKQTYCPTSIKWCYENLADIPVYLALPMDILYFDWELNGIPNHIGFAKERVSDQVLKTLEGNTSKVDPKTGKVVATGVVATRSRNAKYVQAVFRPHYPTTFDISKPLEIDGYFGYNSIAMLQKVLGLTPTAILDKATVKALQKLVGVKRDGSWGKKTSKAVQKMVKTDIDGEFGPKSVKALQKWINKAAKFPEEKSEKKSEKPVEKAEKSTEKVEKTWQEKACDWADDIAESGKYHYVRWNPKDKSTHTCPICKGREKKSMGWNCIGFGFACLHHGAKLKTKCSCSVISDDIWEKILNAKTDKEANELASEKVGAKVKVIRNGGKAIPLNKLEQADICAMFNDKEYYHTIFYRGDGTYADCTSGRTPNIQSGMSLSDKAKSKIKVAIRYIGK